MSLRGVPQLASSGIIVRLARCSVEVDRANRLVWQNYIEEGYWDDERPFLANRHMFLPARIVVVVEDQGNIIGTASLVRDSREKLPLDQYQAKVIKQLRQSGDTLAEVSALALNKNHKERGTLIFFLFKYLYQYAFHYAGIDRFVIATNSSHAAFYRRVCCFEKLEWDGDYEYVKASQKSELLTLHLLKAHRAFYERYEQRSTDLDNFYRFMLVNSHSCLRFPSNSRMPRSRGVNWLEQSYLMEKGQAISSARKSSTSCAEVGGFL